MLYSNVDVKAARLATSISRHLRLQSPLRRQRNFLPIYTEKEGRWGLNRISGSWEVRLPSKGNGTRLDWKAGGLPGN